MDKKQAEKKTEKPVVKVVDTRKIKMPKTMKKGDDITLMAAQAPAWKTKRKDSRQVKIEILEKDVSMLVSELSSFAGIIGGLKSENNDLKYENNVLRNENQELREGVSKGIEEVRNAMMCEVMKDSDYKEEVIRLKKWVWILAGTLFAYSVLNIVLVFYGI